jgi:hypothetical protein
MKSTTFLKGILRWRVKSLGERLKFSLKESLAKRRFTAPSIFRLFLWFDFGAMLQRAGLPITVDPTTARLLNPVDHTFRHALT